MDRCLWYLTCRPNSERSADEWRCGRVDLLTTATSPQIRDRNPQTAVLPIGSFEQHSTFLPLITDTVVACAIGIELERRYDVLLLPPVTISCSHEHAAFA